MADIAEILRARATPQAPKDRITSLLTNQSPQLADISRAFIQSQSQPVTGRKQSFGEILNSVRGARIKEAATVHDMHIKEELFGLKEKKIAVEMAQAKMDGLAKADKASFDTLKAFGFTPEENSQIYDYIDKLPYEVNYTNAHSEIIKAADALGLKGKPTRSSSEFERLHEKVEGGTATRGEIDRYNLLRRGGSTMSERDRARYKDLYPKIKRGTATDDEQAEFSLLTHHMTQFRQVGPQLYGIAPTTEAPSAPAGVPATTGTKITPIVKAEPKPLSANDQADIFQAREAQKLFQEMEAGLSESGIVEGRFSKGQAAVGFNQKAIVFQAARDRFKLAAQSLIKGIPSNFDVQTIIDTLPDLSLPESVNRARLAAAKRAFGMLVATKIQFFKGLNYQIPKDLADVARAMGVNPDSLTPLAPDKAGEALDKAMATIELYKSKGPEGRTKVGDVKTYDPATGQFR